MDVHQTNYEHIIQDLYLYHPSIHILILVAPPDLEFLIQTLSLYRGMYQNS